MLWMHVRSEPLRRFRSSKPFVLTAISLAVFTDSFLYALIVPVLPFALIERVNVDKAEIQSWIGTLLASFGAGVLIGSPIAGWFADRASSRQLPYLLGLIALAGSTLAFSLGRSIYILILGRLLQGFSAAIVFTVGLAIIADIMESQDGIGPAMGYVNLSATVGFISGPVVGGLLYNQAGYHAVFASAYILVAVDLMLRLLMLERETAPSQHIHSEHDARGYGTQSSNDDDFKRPSADGLEAHTKTCPSRHSVLSCNDPLLPHRHTSGTHVGTTASALRSPMLELLSTPRMLAAILGCFMQSIILTGFETILPLRLSTMFGYNSTQIAMLFLTLMVPSFAAPAVGWLSDRHGPKLVIAIGFFCASPCLILLRLVDHHDVGQVALLCALLSLISLALTMALTPAMSEVMYVVDEMESNQPGIFGSKGAYAQGFGLMNMAFASGSFTGPLLGGQVARIAGWNTTTLGAGLLCAACTVPILYATGGKGSRPGSRTLNIDEHSSF